MRLLSQLLSLQNPSVPHTLLTRVLISGVIVFADLVYAGFFGVLGAVAFYLVGVELLGAALVWMYLPLALALLAGALLSFGSLRDYWQNYGHGGA